MEKKDLLVVSSKLKKYSKTKGVTIGVEAMDYLSRKIENIINKASKNAIKDGRKVIKPRDLEAEEEIND
jgi:histone H3/H4